MKKSKIFSSLLGSIIILSVIFVLIFRYGVHKSTYEYKVKINRWDNVYSYNNIKFYYMNKESKNLLELKKIYDFDKITEGHNNELDKTVAIMNWLSKKVEVRASAMKSNKTSEILLEEVETNKVLSSSDFNNIMEDALSSIGIVCRVGEFRANNSLEMRDRSEYEVLEIWSNTHSKWIMIDGVIGSYIEKDNVPISATELFKSDISTLNVYNLNNSTKYFKNISKYLASYTIKVNNDKFQKNNSNSLITIVKNKEDIQIETLNGFVKPTIFVLNDSILNKSPNIVYHNDEIDEVPTIILAKKNLKEDTEEYTKFTVGAFLNSYMLDEYYISINGKEYNPVKKYYDLSLPKGITTLSFSVDGKSELRRIEFEVR